jgi:cytochrome c peroxidase
MAVFAVLLLALGCERAQRFPPAPTGKMDLPQVQADDLKSKPVRQDIGWLERQPVRPEIPLLFIAEDTQPREWATLKAFWNAAPLDAAVALVGQSPLETAIAAQAAQPLYSVKIKVPRGLPDPAPLKVIPASNPPTYGAWLLGRRLFFANVLQMPPGKARSCADCHDPAHGFAGDPARADKGRRAAPSLLNSLYNRQQFWDGRVMALEEVLLRQLDDEQLRPAAKDADPEQSPLARHVFPGLVEAFRAKAEFIAPFDVIYGGPPTANNIAKALATYLRTLLSGGSVYDQAVYHAKQRKAADPDAEDFAAVLAAFPSRGQATHLAQQLARGHQLFHGRARCYVCHPGPLFSDDGFHNAGVGDSGDPILHSMFGKEPGRFAVVPYGLKDRRLIGAYKTPRLRDVSLKAVFFHDGSKADLVEVLKYFAEGLDPLRNDHLDVEFIEPGTPPEERKQRQLHLEPRDLRALELYLRALRGAELDPVLGRPGKR